MTHLLSHGVVSFMSTTHFVKFLVNSIIYKSETGSHSTRSVITYCTPISVGFSRLSFLQEETATRTEESQTY